MRKFVLLLCLAILSSGCAGVNYSSVHPEARDFHPQAIGILPVIAGDHLSAADVADKTVSESVAKTGWFPQVVDAGSTRSQLAASQDLSAQATAYIQKLTTLGISDKDLAGKIAETMKVDALLLASVTSWGYGRLEGNKIGKVGLALQLISAKSGVVLWKASHEKTQKYWVIKPDLGELALEVMEQLLKEIPH